jgi:amidohydrolase
VVFWWGYRTRLKGEGMSSRFEASGSDAATQRIKALGAQLEPAIVAWRRKFHAHPELSKHEFWTQEAICAELDKMCVPYRLAASTGVIATIEGAAPGAYAEDGTAAARVALRSDIDALPVTEATGAEFASENEGVMHACGHDCHIAMMLGAVGILNEMRADLRGEVRVIFQPAEEISCGAKMMIEAGALDGVDGIYGAHIWTEVEAGKISCEAGQRMANTDWFRVDIEGVSAHGSMPHKGIDAIVVAANLVSALQVLVSRDVSPFEPVVVTIGEIHGGKARNIMAGSAYIAGTVRTWTPAMAKAVPERIEQIVTRTCSAYGARAKLSYTRGNPGLSNDAACAARAQQSVRRVLGDCALATYEGTLSGEDFSEYLAFVPGVFAFIGARNEAAGAVHPQHSCYYTIDESVLVGGAMVAAQYAVDFLADYANQ